MRDCPLPPGRSNRCLRLLAAPLFVLALALTAHAETTSLPTYISTPEGFKHTENNYIPGVTHAELGWFAQQTRNGKRSECLKAQAIAARTYVLRWLNANGHTRTIRALGPSFQAWTSRFSTHTKNAAQAVSGQVMTYGSQVIYSNYASGAWPLNSNGFPNAPSAYRFPSSHSWDYIRDQYLARWRGQISWSTFNSRVTRHNSWAWTYVLNTDNEGRSGSSVIPTIHASRNSRNRGGLGQYRAYWLDRNRDYGYQRIIRAFYGEDITIVGAPNAGSSTPSTPAPSNPAPSAPAPGGSGSPDLVVTQFSIQNRDGSATHPAVGHRLTVVATVRNNGGSMTGSQPITLSVRVGSTEVGTGVTTARLGAGQEVSVPMSSGTWRPGNPGSFTVKVKVDPRNAVTERNESNNERTASRTVYVPIEITASALNARAGTSTQYRRLGLLKRGQRYMANAVSGDWYRIDLKNGFRAWCHGGYAQRVSGATGVIIRASALNVRTGPSTSYGRIGSAGGGQVFVENRASNGWSRIHFDSRDGWCAATSDRYAVRAGF